MSQSEVFDKIAPGWYGYRHHTIFPDELAKLAERWKGGKLLNAGCGHGADFVPFKDNFELVGMDFSAEMLRYARRFASKYVFDPCLVRGDMQALPFADRSFDYVIAVASYHHIKEGANQLRAMQELKRVLKPGGEAFITLWNHYQPRFWLRRSDTLVPWRSNNQVYYRYYHLFSFAEAERLVKRAGFVLVKAEAETGFQFPIKYFSRNICLLVRKPETGRE